jgi:two-component system, OmpR family, response regulator TctD
VQVLLIEDEQALRHTLERTLTRQGWSVHAAQDGEQGLSQWERIKPNIVLLDLSLPKMDGLKVLEAGRKLGLQTPVLILTARGTVGDKIIGLNSGADDYLPKPFDLDELEARMNALLRRNNSFKENRETPNGDLSIVRAGLLKLELSSGAIFIVDPAANAHPNANQMLPLELAPRESRMLRALMMKTGQALTKEQLFNQVFRDEPEVNIEAVEVVAYRLRKRLVDSGCELITLRGLGYLLRPL